MMTPQEDLVPTTIGAADDGVISHAMRSARHKLVVMGHQAVGKTAVVLRFAKGIFDASMKYQPTVGVEFFSKTLTIENETLRFQLWDTAGQSRFHGLLPGFLKDASAVIVVYDVTDRQSFANTSKWVEEVRDANNSTAVFLVGNKADLADKRQVSLEEGQQHASNLGAEFIETSAKTDYNVKSLFRQMADTLLYGGQKREPASEPARDSDAGQKIPSTKNSLWQMVHGWPLCKFCRRRNHRQSVSASVPAGGAEILSEHAGSMGCAV